MLCFRTLKCINVPSGSESSELLITPHSNLDVMVMGMGTGKENGKRGRRKTLLTLMARKVNILSLNTPPHSQPSACLFVCQFPPPPFLLQRDGPLHLYPVPTPNTHQSNTYDRDPGKGKEAERGKRPKETWQQNRKNILLKILYF